MTQAYEELKTVDEVQDLMSEGGGVAIIDFWSSTCGPCQAMAPHFAECADAFSNDPIRFIKIQTDTHPELAGPFKIRSVPTLLFVKNGEILDAVVGFMDGPGLAKKAHWLLKKQAGGGFFSRIFGS